MRCLFLVALAACGADPGLPATLDASGPPVESNRDRLIRTYFEFAPGFASTCDVWTKLTPSARAVFLTLTARMQGAVLGDDGSRMLDHVTRLYRLVGGQNATATDPGTCGGGEYNRMIMSIDPHLHATLRAANAHQGAVQPNGKVDLADIPAGGFWRDSHDLGGPHPPFDLSDETDAGGPRGQVQYFSDPASTLANTPLGRMDLTTLVDPYAFEMDQDYDCAHNSNPLCSYRFYGPACLPRANLVGVDIYTAAYGTSDPQWKPAGCK